MRGQIQARCDGRCDGEFFCSRWSSRASGGRLAEKAPIIFVQIDTCLLFASWRVLWAVFQWRSPFLLMPKEMGRIGRHAAFSLRWWMGMVSVIRHRSVLLEY